MKQVKRPVSLMTLAQVICTLAIPLTLTIPTFEPGMYSYAVHLRNLLLTVCLIWVEIEVFRLCGRMKKSSSFSPLNAAGLGRIAKALCVAGVTSLLFGDSIVPFLLTGLPAVALVVERLLLPFTLLTLALMARAVQVLMRRAAAMQEEADLTI